MKELVLDLRDKSIERVKLTFYENDKVSVVYVKRDVGNEVTQDKDDKAQKDSKEIGKVTVPNATKTVGETEIVSKNEGSKRNNRWTQEKVEEFCKDYASMPISEVSKKWGLTKSTCTFTKCKFSDTYNRIIRGAKGNEGES